MSADIKPCPFCSSDKTAIRTDYDPDGCIWNYVKCSNCGARSAGKWASDSSDRCPNYFSEVRGEWNNRAAAPQPQLPQGVEEFIAARYCMFSTTAEKFISEADLRSWMTGHVRVPVELFEFIEAKEHHLPIEDRHALSVMLNASKEEGK